MPRILANNLQIAIRVLKKFMENFLNSRILTLSNCLCFRCSAAAGWHSANGMLAAPGKSTYWNILFITEYSQIVP